MTDRIVPFVLETLLRLECFNARLCKAQCIVTVNNGYLGVGPDRIHHKV